MKKQILILFFCGLSSIGKSQNVSVEKSTFGIQTGFFGAWVHNESKLAKLVTLRSEIGFDSGFFGGSNYDRVGIVLSPVVTLEPRLYYNLDKREARSSRIDGNSGNFVSLKTSYHPDWFAISNYKIASRFNDISIVPTWGIRRNIGQHFNYETGIGIGYIRYLGDRAENLKNKGGVDVNLHLRIGYRF